MSKLLLILYSRKRRTFYHGGALIILFFFTFQDHVYVYDGIPVFVDSKGDGVLLGAFCGFQDTRLTSVTATSGVITIYFDADISGHSM